MSNQTIWEIVYLFWVIFAFGLTWWRLVWAIQRGDRWELEAERSSRHRLALSLEIGGLKRELETVKRERDELRDHVGEHGAKRRRNWWADDPPF